MAQAEELSRRPRSKNGPDGAEATPLIGRTAPHSLDAEEALLACCVIDAPETLSLCHEKNLKAEAFFKPAHQVLYQVVNDMHSSGDGVDLITLSNKLSGRSLGSLRGFEKHPEGSKTLFDYIGGFSVLNRITSRIESTIHARDWLNIVMEKWILRRLIASATSVVENCYTNQDELETFIDKVEQEIFKISQDRVSDSTVTLAKSVEDATTLISRMISGESGQGVPTGYIDLDRMTFGLHKGDMVVLAARPSMGKTSLAMNIAEQVALPKKGEGVPVMVFSLEMGADQLAMRMLCRRARVNMKRVREGMLGKDDMRQLATAAGEMKKGKVWIDDSGHITILELRAKARRLQSRIQRDKPLGLIVIDYLQLISGSDSRVQREQQIAEISRGIKSLAKELAVPVIVLSQLNREAEKENRQPRLSDLRESGSIEQDADVVLLLAKDRESEDKASVPSGTRKVNLIIAKQRNGPVGSIDLTFVPDYTSFENFTESPL